MSAGHWVFKVIIPHSLPLCPSIQNNSNCTLATKAKKPKRETTREREREKKKRGRRKLREVDTAKECERAEKGQKERGSPAAH